MRRILLSALALTPLLASSGWAQSPPVYDEGADAQADVRRALADAAQAQLPLLVVFGANWCGDCKVLDTAFKSGAAAPLIRQRFRVVKVNVGRFDRNVDLAQAYGVPLKKGIPAVAVVSPQGQTVYTTKAGELADARQMGDTAIHDFFARVASNGRP